MSRLACAALALPLLAGCQRPSLYELVTPSERLKQSNTPWIARSDAMNCVQQAAMKVKGARLAGYRDAPSGEWPDDLDVRRFLLEGDKTRPYIPMIYETPRSSFAREVYAGTTVYNSSVAEIPPDVAVAYVNCMRALGYSIHRMQFANTPAGWVHRFMVVTDRR